MDKEKDILSQALVILKDIPVEATGSPASPPGKNPSGEPARKETGSAQKVKESPSGRPNPPAQASGAELAAKLRLKERLVKLEPNLLVKVLRTLNADQLDLENDNPAGKVSLPSEIPSPKAIN
jgi:hypothetical protein